MRRGFLYPLQPIANHLHLNKAKLISKLKTKVLPKISFFNKG